MTNKTVIRRDKILLQKAQAVFGDDLVTDAFVCTWDFGGENAEKIAERLSYEMHLPNGKEDSGLSYDCQTIMLVFINGRSVEFSNSEWASMDIHNKAESYEL